MRPLRKINVGFAQDSRKYFVSFAKNGRLQIKEFRSTAIDFPAMADDTPRFPSKSRWCLYEVASYLKDERSEHKNIQILPVHLCDSLPVMAREWG